MPGAPRWGATFLEFDDVVQLHAVSRRVLSPTLPWWEQRRRLRGLVDNLHHELQATGGRVSNIDQFAARLTEQLCHGLEALHREGA